MPELKCTVQTCVHNKQFLCNLDKIQVGGSDAKTGAETSCDSFQDRESSGYSNGISQGYSGVSKHADEKSGVDCKAKDCMYNCDCECQAGKISVEGSNACHCGGTECATFKCEC